MPNAREKQTPEKHLRVERKINLESTEPKLKETVSHRSCVDLISQVLQNLRSSECESELFLSYGIAFSRRKRLQTNTAHLGTLKREPASRGQKGLQVDDRLSPLLGVLLEVDLHVGLHAAQLTEGP
ncbi:unnamed protein product [Ixodes persulcatus]